MRRTDELFLEPPPAPESDGEPIGFSPDLVDASGEGEATLPDLRPAARAAPASTRYPLGLAAVARLLGEEAPAEAAPTPAPPHGQPAPAPFSIGPAIMRAPPPVALPPLVGDGADEEDDADAGGDATSTDEMLGELVDMVLVGDPSGGGHEVHLVFKAEVFSGLHLKLVRRPDGLYCTFLVEDAMARRAVLGRVDELLVRLRDRGFKVAGYEVEVRG